ncbi:hypothetical protein D3C78_1851710 [compost metagenome]
MTIGPEGTVHQYTEMVVRPLGPDADALIDQFLGGQDFLGEHNALGNGPLDLVGAVIGGDGDVALLAAQRDAVALG